MLKTILSISGKPGLYRLLSSGNNVLIVESLETKKRLPILPKDRVVALSDISMFTDGVPVEASILKDNEALRASFGEVLPNFDRERVYTSDIKKLYSWYNLLIGAGITDFSDREEEA